MAAAEFLTFYFSCVAKCIDHYTKQCVENAELPEGEKKPVDERLEGIVNKMFQRCLDDHKYKQAIGIALETRRLDVFQKTILESVRPIVIFITDFFFFSMCAFSMFCQLTITAAYK